MSSSRQLPFLPGIASPSVQTSFQTDRSCTSYSEQYKGHVSQQRPLNHSLEHHAAARRNCTLSHAEDPAAHYATSTNQITSPDRLVALRGSRRPDPFPLEPKDRRLRTSHFTFRTTNEEMFAAVLARPVTKQPRASRRRGTISLGQDDAPSDGHEPPHFRSTKQLNDERTQSSLRDMSSTGTSARQPPFSFQDEIQMDHAYLGLGGVASHARLDAKPIADHWKQPLSQRPELTSPSRGALPSINLAYKDERLAEDDDLLCRKCKYRRQQHAHSVMDLIHRRATPSPAYMQTTYQATMHDPRAHSSLY